MKISNASLVISKALSKCLRKRLVSQAVWDSVRERGRMLLLGTAPDWLFSSLQNLYESIKNEPFKIPEDDGNDLTHTFFNPDREGWLLKLGEPGRVGPAPAPLGPQQQLPGTSCPAPSLEPQPPTTRQKA